MEQLAVPGFAHFIHHRGLKIDEGRARNVPSGVRFREERVERIVSEFAMSLVLIGTLRCQDTALAQRVVHQ